MGKREFEVERTCKRCGEVRFLPTGSTVAPKKAKATGWLTPMVGKKRNELRAQNAMILLAQTQVADLARCPGCGSSSFSDRHVPV